MIGSNIGDNMKKISVKTIYLLALISIGLISLGVGSTFAMFTATTNLNDSITILTDLDYTSDIIELFEIKIEPTGLVDTITTSVCNNSHDDKNIVVWYQNETGIEVAFGQGDQNVLEDKFLEAQDCGQFDLAFINRSDTYKRLIVGVSASTENVVLSSKMKPVSSSLELSVAEKIRYIYLYGSLNEIVADTSYNANTDAKLISLSNTDYNNIRYYGSNPNNYIKFNCEEYPNTNCETWRIIGIVDGKVKLMRSVSIGEYSWDSSEGSIGGTGTEVMGNDSSNNSKVEFLDNNIYDTSAVPIAAANNGHGINEWSQADIMKVLNPGYEMNSDTIPLLRNNSIVSYVRTAPISNSLYYNSGSGTCYNDQKQGTTSCDFTNISFFSGIKNNVATKGKIAEVTYHTGGLPSAAVSPLEAFHGERSNLTVSNPADGITRTTTWTGRIALPYSSDYAYATDLSLCNKTLANYYNSSCKSNNWMYSLFGTTKSTWLLTPSTASASAAYNITNIVLNQKGSMNDSAMGGASTAAQIFPVLYLSDDAIIDSGDGSSSSPYTLKP